MRIWAGIIFYNDGVNLLRDTFESCRKSGCHIIAVDGAYKEFPRKPNEKPWSTDGCQEYARENADVFIGARECWDSEFHKRTQYIKPIPEGEYCLYIDSDEKLGGGIMDLKQFTKDRYSMAFHEESEDGKIKKGNKHFRIFKVYKDMEYRNFHFWLYRTSKIKNKNDFNSGFCRRDFFPTYAEDVNGNIMTIEHYPLRRGLPRLDQDGEYKRTKSELSVPQTETKLHHDREMQHDDGNMAEIVKVEYIGNEVYSSAFVENARNGKVFSCPRHEMMRMINDFGPLNFKEVQNG